MLDFLNNLFSYDISIEKKNKEHFIFIKKYFTIRTSSEVFLNDTSLYVIATKWCGELVGVSIFCVERDNVHLNYTAVKKEHRNKKINFLMMEELVIFAKVLSAYNVTANVRSPNKYSVKSLTSSGFSVDENNITKYTNGDLKLPLYINI